MVNNCSARCFFRVFRNSMVEIIFVLIGLACLGAVFRSVRHAAIHVAGRRTASRLVDLGVVAVRPLRSVLAFLSGAFAGVIFACPLCAIPFLPRPIIYVIA